MRGRTQHDGSAVCSEDRIPAGFDPQSLNAALCDISSLNGALLERLVAYARNPVPGFPLHASLRARFAELSVERQITIAQCGVLLAHMEFSNLEFWRSVQQARNAPELIPEPLARLGGADAVPYSIAVLFGSLYLLRAAPNLALLVLGMSPAVAHIYVQLSERTLLSTAQALPQLLRPRWSNRPDTWEGILDLCDEVSPNEPSKMNSHCFTLSAAELPPLQPYFRSPGEERSAGFCRRARQE